MVPTARRDGASTRTLRSAGPAGRLQRFARKNFLFRRCSAGDIGRNPCALRIFSASRTDIPSSAGKTGTRMITGASVREIVFDVAFIVGLYVFQCVVEASFFLPFLLNQATPTAEHITSRTC